MTEAPPIERCGEDYALELGGLERRYRVVVPRQLLDDEAGTGATDDERRDWIAANLQGILSALTARETGGIVREPWGRVVVEEVP